MKEIKLYGLTDGVLEIQLVDIFTNLTVGEKYLWKVLWLNAFGTFKNEPIQKIEDKVKHNNGMLIPYEDIFLFSRNHNQLVDFVIIGHKNQDIIKKIDISNYQNYSLEYLIELCDSTFWKVSSKDINFLHRSLKIIAGVEINW